jgi:Protein of unknown function (DUF1559)
LARQGLKSFPANEEPKEVLALAKALVSGITVEAKESKVTLAIDKPKNFEKLLESASKDAKKSASAAQTMNRFKQIGLSMHNYVDAYRKMPFGPVDEKQSADLSWRVRVLPFLEQAPLYESFKMDEPWDSEHNVELVDKMPAMYGADGVCDVSWIQSDVRGFEHITDGTSNTIAFLQNPNMAMSKWTENVDLGQEEAVELVKSLMDGETLIAIFYDGSVRRLSNKTSQEILERLFDPQDGEVVNEGGIK